MIESWWLPVTVAVWILVHIAKFAVATVRLRSHGLQNGEQLRQRQAALIRSSQVARMTSSLGDSAASRSATPWRILEVADVVQESADCRSFYLVDPYGQPLPGFCPGQYVMIRPAMAGAYQATRCYSLSSSPDSRFWRITVKRQEPARDPLRSNTGGLSDWLHRTIDIGDYLFVGGPSGQFYLPTESDKDIVLIAAGVGITPLASMLRWSLEQTPARPVTLFYQAQNGEHWPLGRVLHRWQESFESMRAHTFFSRATAEEIQSLAAEGIGSFHAGKFDGNAVAKIAANLQADYYLCGPDSWMEQLRDQLVACGVAPNRVHWESFGSQAVMPTSESMSGEAHTIQFALSDLEAEWRDPEQSLWELAKANQIELPSGCLSGVCGSCRVKLVSGKVQYDRQIGVELASGECLTCVARPTSDLVLEA
jgi:ferredoxin-NADP reductase